MTHGGDADQVIRPIVEAFEKLGPAGKKAVAVICDTIAPTLGLIPDPRAAAIAVTLTVLCRTVRR